MTVSLLVGGLRFAEGPLWLTRPVAAQNGWEGAAVLVSDIDADVQHLVPVDGGPPAVSVARTPSDGANGNAVGPDGFVWSCEHGSRRVSRRTADGSHVTVVDSFDGCRLNSPNDLCGASDGSMYFTDPPYGVVDADRELPFQGLFRVDPAGGVHLVDDSLVRPNGVAVDPEGRHLWVADTETGHIIRFGLGDDHSVGERSVVFTADRPDGLAFDSAGNLLIAALKGIVLIDRDGTVVQPVIELPQRPANLCFAGDDLESVIVCARTAIYRLRWPRPGCPLVAPQVADP